MSNLSYWAKLPLINNFLLKILKNNREKIHEIFINNTIYNEECSLIDIGTTADKDESHNIILRKTQNNKKISCFSDQNISFLKEKYTNINQFYIGDAKKTELENESFDITYSSATIEHVGSFQEQINFVKECLRISKKQVFITTPNRFYPIDFHTKIPFLHWLPKKIHRKILSLIGLKFYSLEENLNLLDKESLIKITEKINIKNFKIIDHKFLKISSNLILIINK
tara:strand:+ start:110 stop:787 length:678 start_codon:yes stop_codon:yes gene_type:complete